MEQPACDLRHMHLLPIRQLLVFFVVFQRNGMGADKHIHFEPDFNKSLEIIDIRARRVPHHKTCRKMDRFGAVFNHFFRHIFNVTAGASTAV